MADVITSGGGAKYRALIIFISVFVLLVVTVLAANFYVAAQFQEDSLAINLAGRQRMLSQRMTKTIEQVKANLQAGQEIAGSLDELTATSSLFGRTITAFNRGGETADASGNSVQLSPAVDDAQTAVRSALPLWGELSEGVDALLASDLEKLGDVSQLIAELRDKNGELLGNMDSVTRSLELAAAPAELVNIAGRQRMLSQRMVKNLALAISATDEAALQARLAEFRTDVDLFDESLALLESQPVEVFATDTNSPQVLDASESLWRPIRAAADRLLADSGVLGNLLAASTAAAVNNLDLLRYMNDLTVALEQQSSGRSAVLRWVQVAGIVLALAMFGAIVFYFLRQLREGDKQIAEAKNETDQILATVKDGLFLMDKEFTIGQQHSHSLRNIMNQDQLAGSNFVQILKKIVPEKTLKTAQDFFDLLFGDRVNENLIGDLNPLDEVEVFFEKGDGNFEVKHLGFSFKRAKAGDEISHLLVQVDDISAQIQLERELRESKAKAKEQFDLMLRVLHVEPTMLREFLASAESSLEEINDILRARSSNQAENREKLDSIYRKMHSIKGDAASLELGAFEDRTHTFENKLSKLREKPDLEGGDFLPLTIELDEFMGQIDSLKALIRRLSDLQNAVRSEDGPAINPDDSMFSLEVDSNGEDVSTEPATGALAERLTRLAERIAQEEGKQVRIDVRLDAGIPEDKLKPLGEILIQLVRNGVVHGIETPEIRVARGKAPDGRITVAVEQSKDDQLAIRVHDDGHGLNATRIREAAVNKGIVSPDQAATMDARQLTALIFKPGFSTSTSVSKHAGRGVGMDVVASQVSAIGGKLKLRTADEKYCEFEIRVPSPQAISA